MLASCGFSYSLNPVQGYKGRDGELIRIPTNTIQFLDTNVTIVPQETGGKFNIHKTFRTCPGCILNIFNPFLSTGLQCINSEFS